MLWRRPGIERLSSAFEYLSSKSENPRSKAEKESTKVEKQVPTPESLLKYGTNYHAMEAVRVEAPPPLVKLNLYAPCILPKKNPTNTAKPLISCWELFIRVLSRLKPRFGSGRLALLIYRKRKEALMKGLLLGAQMRRPWSSVNNCTACKK